MPNNNKPTEPQKPLTANNSVPKPLMEVQGVAPPPKPPASHPLNQKKN